MSAIERGPLFVIENGAVITSAHIGHYLLTRDAKLPITKFTSHDLRRTFATMLAEMGVALHKSAEMESAGRIIPLFCCRITYFRKPAARATLTKGEMR